MKKKPLYYYLDLMKFALEKQDWNKAKRHGEIVLKKLDIFSYSPREEYLLYGRIGYAFLQLAEYSRSLDNYYNAHLIATKHHLSPADIDHTSHMMGHIFSSIGNLNQAITQFQKVEQSGYDSSLMDKTHYFKTLIDLGYCYLYKNDIEKVRELIETKLSPCLSLSDKLILKHYYHFKGEYLTVIGEYNQARELFQKSIAINKELNLPKLILDINLHLAVIDLLEGQLKLGIKNLESLLKDSRRLKLNDLICEIGLVLNKCHTLENRPDKAISIEKHIKPILNKLDIVWLYEKTRHFEQVYRQLQSIYQSDSNPIPTILINTLNHHYEKSDYKHIIVGQSAPMRDVYQLIEKVAPTDLPILIQGETGTGKELIARALHHQSLRKENVWLALNCGAVPETLLENELFGHTKGAFTDAHQDKKGYIELASVGTLFLDEIAEMSPSMQQKLLRVLEEKLIWQLGAQKPISVNTRFIFASNQNIEQMVSRKLFRLDLFHRINTIVITLPPLRDRKDDIPLLINHFLNKYSRPKVYPEVSEGSIVPRISSETSTLLHAYPWPGNVRELENEIKRICTLYTHNKQITELMLSQSIRNYKSCSILSSNTTSLTDLTDNFQRNLIKDTMIKCNGNLSKSARLLGYGRGNLHRKIRQLKMQFPKFVT